MVVMRKCRKAESGSHDLKGARAAKTAAAGPCLQKYRYTCFMRTPERLQKQTGNNAQEKKLTLVKTFAVVSLGGLGTVGYNKMANHAVLCQ